MSGTDKRIFRFGVFEADASSCELRKAGLRVRLQEQPFQVLLLLVERQGEVVSREEIRQRLWPSDTFVDFDHSLNTNINKIRDALGDSAANPRFVETLAKRGYRFLVPVDVGVSLAVKTAESARCSGDAQAIEALPASAAPGFGLTRVEELPAVAPGYIRALLLLIQAMYLVFYTVVLGRLAALQDVVERLAPGHAWVEAGAILSACVGIPVRLYVFSAIAFDVRRFSRQFLRIFPGLLLLDELWALSPFLLTRQIGIGLALAATAALAYVPFAQRTLILMRDRSLKS